MEFKGTSPEFTEVYIIDEKPHEEDLETGYPLSGPRGNFICSLLGSMSLLDKTRMACWQGQSPDVVKEDILKCNPKVIIGLGSSMMNEFITTTKSITDMSGEVVDTKLDDQEFKFLCLMSPSYILKRVEDSELTLRFSQDLYKAFQIVSGEFRDILKEKKVLSAHSSDEFIKICEDNFKNDSTIAYDIETNARPAMTKGSKIIGFSVSNKTAGVYASIDSLDFTMSEEEEDKIWDYVINNLFSKRLIIHNTMYERPYTLYCKNYEIKYEDADDTLVMARLLKGSKEGAGLKYQAQKNLQYPDWETDLTNYISGFRSVVSRIIFGPKKFNPIWSLLSSKTYNLVTLKESEEFKSLPQEDKDEISSMVDKIINPMKDLYTEEEIENLADLLNDKFITVEEQNGIQDSTIPYNWIPDRVLSKYGAIDSLATFDLKEYFEKFMDEESTDTVDLHKGYENWLEHMYVAYIMERNGLFWNEDLVKQDEEFLTKQATRCLKDMIISSEFEPHAEMLVGWKYKPIILSDYLPEIAKSQGFEVEYTHETNKYIVKFQGKRVSKSRISEILTPPSYKSQYSEIVKDLIKEEVEQATHYDQLKEIYNPSSPSQSDIPRIILINDTLQMGGRVNQLHTLSVSPEFETTIDNLPRVDQKFIKTAHLLGEPKELKTLYGEEWATKRKEIFEGFVRMYNSDLKYQVTTPEICSILNNLHPVEIDSFDDGGIIEIYNNLVVTGIDQDDKRTWTPQFEWMINFRLFKKSQKIISSYIEGSVGRESVVVVDRNSVRRGDHCVERKRSYENKISDDEEYLMAAKWSPNTAETGRWRSAQHTIPWGSQVKKYYTSRFIGGTCLAPDYSQMEVRTLAAISKDENMLNLFYSGRDFHSETAAQVWQKPVEEVTTAERRFSKTATFSLLYGAMEESFAKNYCNGDMAMAEKIYGGFFRAYPRVKEWVDARHQEVMRDHRVSLELSNRFIPILPEGEGKGALNSMLRKSQNYPIQAQSADLTGCVIFDLQKYIEENNMKSLVIMYVHDSIEVDVYPYELIKLVDKLKVLLNESPMRRMGLPSKADVTLGKSLGHEIEMESIEYNEDFTDGVLTLKGYKDEVYETIQNWKDAYNTVEILEEDWKEEFVSMSELFILRKAYTPTLGTLRHKGTCKVHINYYR